MTKMLAPRVCRYLGAKPSQSFSPVPASTSATSKRDVLRLSARNSASRCQIFDVSIPKQIGRLRAACAIMRSFRRSRNRYILRVRSVRLRQPEEQLLQFAIIFVLRQLVLFFAIQEYGVLEGVATCHLFNCETLLRVAAHQVQLLREKAIDRGSFFRLFDRPQADEPISRRA